MSPGIYEKSIWLLIQTIHGETQEDLVPGNKADNPLSDIWRDAPANSPTYMYREHMTSSAYRYTTNERERARVCVCVLSDIWRDVPINSPTYREHMTWITYRYTINEHGVCVWQFIHHADSILLENKTKKLKIQL